MKDNVTILSRDEETLAAICRHVSNGGSLIDLCELWKADYTETLDWIRSSDELSERYDKAMSDRNEWVRQRLLKELGTVAFGNMRDFFDPETGSIKTPSKWTKETGALIESISITQKQSAQGDVEETYKLKSNSKLKAIELLFKNLKMFTDRVEVEGEVKLEDILAKVHQHERKNS